jgi:hypothetical protein
MKPLSISFTDEDDNSIEKEFFYADNVTKVVDRLRSDLEDAWWMLKLRMQAWYLHVKLIDREGIMIPSRYCYDPRRVYIL